MDQPNLTFAKILIMDTGKFKQWKFRIQQYLQNKHYALWEVIEFDDSYKAPQEDAASESSAKKKGRTVVITTEDIQKRRNDVKARTTLLLALPDEHQLRFSKYETAQELLQAIVSHLEFMDVEIEQDDLNKKFLTSLAPERLMYTIVWRNRDDLDTMSLDDVYNHLKVYEHEVQKKSELNSQNMAFISSANTSSRKGEVHTASVLTASTQVSTASADVAAVGISHDTVCVYIASQSNGSHIKYEDITQIDEDDIEEMDTKWFKNHLKRDTIGVEVDFSNMESSIPSSPTPTFKIHKDHPKSQIIGPVDTPEEPKKIFDALKDPSWVEAMQEELLQFKIQNVWILVDCPKGIRPIGTKWVLKNKKDERGIVIRNKARLVAQGHTQEEGIDYKEVFAPVARIEAIRLFLAYALFIGFTVYQMDVKSAFLYGTIDEEVYVMQPPGFQDLEFPDRVYKVEKAMYRLHQDPRAWSANTPMDKENPWGKDGPGKYVELHLYRSMIGSLMYLTASRPDIMFAVCAYARHQVTPKECHLYAVKRIFRYLKGHPKLGLWYPKESPFDLVAYSDSNYGSATQDRKSTTRGYQFLGRRLISWKCKKQTIVATSTSEAEYVAAASGRGQVLWIQNQMLDYG
nr:ribonuclease H-like domain-containing protein [Tanacetum cinerariifolium]